MSEGPSCNAYLQADCTFFGHLCLKQTVSHFQVIYVSVSVAIILFLYVKSNRQTGWSFYAVFGLVGIVAVLPAVLFLIKFDGMKIILQIMFKNKKSVSLQELQYRF